MKAQAMSGKMLAALARGDAAPLRAALRDAPAAAPVISEYDLNPRIDTAPRALVPAAVLLPIVLRRAPTILFTRRTGHLRRHAGQVSFPGGRCEAGDVSAVETALRETGEETGIDPGFITIAGFLDTYETGTGYAVQPVVGLLREGFSLAPDPQEVAEIFEAPLAFLLDPASWRLETRNWMGRVRRFYVGSHGGHEIWGATAAILVDLSRRVEAAAHGTLVAAAVENAVKGPHADRS